MNKLITRMLTVGLLTGLVAGAPLVNHAADKKPKMESAEKPAKSDLVPIRGKIGAVDKVNLTITLEGKEKSRLIQIKPDTKMTKDGQPATFEAAVVGEEIGGRVKKVGTDQYEAVSLRFGPKPEGNAEPKPKKKASAKKDTSKETQ